MRAESFTGANAGAITRAVARACTPVTAKTAKTIKTT
jgi:hypothetical protein